MLMGSKDFFVGCANNRSIGKTKRANAEGVKFGLTGGLLKAILSGNYHNNVDIARQNFIGLSTFGYPFSQSPSKTIWRYIRI